MRHLKSGRKLKRTASHRKALLNNLATSLIVHEGKSIRTTLAKAKELRPFVEKLITRARIAYKRERAGEFKNGHVDVHQRREVGKAIHNKAALQELFDVIAPTLAERNGGYTRIIKLGQRRGDGAEEAIIQLVDWSAPQDGKVSRSGKKKAATTRKPKAPAVAAAPIEDVVTPVVDSVEAEPIASVLNDEVENVETSSVDVVTETENTIEESQDNDSTEPTSETDTPTA